MNRRSFIRFGTQAAAVVPILGRRPRLRELLAPACRRAAGSRGGAAADRHHHGVLPRTLRPDPRKGGGAARAGSGAHAAHRAEVHCRDARPAQRRDLERAVRRPVDRLLPAGQGGGGGGEIADHQRPGGWAGEPVRPGCGQARAPRSTTIKKWMDRAAAVGAPTCRANTGGGPPEAWDVTRTADSFRQLAPTAGRSA